MTRRLREIFEDLMDESSSDLMSQAFGKLLHEVYKKDQLVREVAGEVQSLSTAAYHLCRDGLHLQKQSQKRQNSRSILEKEILDSFKASTKYAQIFGEVESVFQEFFEEFMRRHHVGIGYTGRPNFKIDFSNVRFNSKSKFSQVLHFLHKFLQVTHDVMILPKNLKKLLSISTSNHVVPLNH